MIDDVMCFSDSVGARTEARCDAVPDRGYWAVLESVVLWSE